MERGENKIVKNHFRVPIYARVRARSGVWFRALGGGSVRKVVLRYGSGISKTICRYTFFIYQKFAKTIDNRKTVCYNQGIKSRPGHGQRLAEV